VIPINILYCLLYLQHRVAISRPGSSLYWVRGRQGVWPKGEYGTGHNVVIRIHSFLLVQFLYSYISFSSSSRQVVQNGEVVCSESFLSQTRPRGGRTVVTQRLTFIWFRKNFLSLDSHSYLQLNTLYLFYVSASSA